MELASHRGALDLRLLCRWHRYTEARCHQPRCRLRPEEVITLLGCASFVGCVTAKFSAELDRVALYALQLLLDLDVTSILFVWILLPLEVDSVRKDGVGVEVKVDGVVDISLEDDKETGTNLRDEVRVLREDCYRYESYDRVSCILLN